MSSGSQAARAECSGSRKMRSRIANDAAFDADGEIRRDGGRRAFVGVRRPHVEGRGGNLEEQADAVVASARKDERIRRTARAAIAVGDLAEIGRARESVQQRKAVSQEAARKAAEQQVLHRCLVGSLLARAGTRP